MSTPIDFRALLNTRKAELVDRLDHIEQDLDAPVSADWEERAVEREDDEVLEALGQTGLAELRRINAALKRMDANIYGVCTDCGNTISDARLTVVPTTLFCRHCAQKRAAH